MKRFVSILLLAALAAACVYPYDEAIKTPDNPVLVFNGNMVVGGNADVSLSLMQGLDGTYPAGIKTKSIDAWWVEDDSGTKYVPSTPEAKASMATASPDKQYRMVMEVDGKTYCTAFQRPLAPPVLEKLEFIADDVSVSCAITFTDGPDKTGYASISVEEKWMFHAMYFQKFDIDPATWTYFALEPDNPGRNYWCWNHAGPGRESPLDYTMLDGHAEQYVVTAFSRRDTRNQRLYNIRVRIRSLSREEYLFQKNLADMNLSGGSLFTPNPGEISGNVMCESDPSQRVLGYVTLSLYDTVEKSLDDRYLIDTPPSQNNLKYIEPDFYEEYFLGGWRPVLEDFLESTFAIVKYWAPQRCVDCVIAGGTLEEPLFSE